MLVGTALTMLGVWFREEWVVGWMGEYYFDAVVLVLGDLGFASVVRWLLVVG